MGWLDGLVRMAPNWETHAFGHTVSWNILIPGLIVPGIMFTGLALWPFIETWVTGDKREHHLLERPRNAPTRTAVGAMALTFTMVTLINGGNDLLATHFGLSINQIMWFSRIGIFVLPPIAYVITKRICLGLQHKDRDTVLHGRESGRLVMLPSGEFIEVHEPIDQYARYSLTNHEQPAVVELQLEDAHGVARPGSVKEKIRARLSRGMYGEQVQKPTEKDLLELEDGHH
jgi:ubiquinol-cytochrome c reductase cytochrome b subunit